MIRSILQVVLIWAVLCASQPEETIPKDQIVKNIDGISDDCNVAGPCASCPAAIRVRESKGDIDQ